MFLYLRKPRSHKATKKATLVTLWLCDEFLDGLLRCTLEVGSILLKRRAKVWQRTGNHGKHESAVGFHHRKVRGAISFGDQGICANAFEHQVAITPHHPLVRDKFVDGEGKGALWGYRGAELDR